MTIKILTSLAISAVLVALSAGMAHADAQSAPKASRFHAALEACAQQLDISLPLDKSHPLDVETRHQLRECLREHGAKGGLRGKFFEKIKTCAASQGVTLPEQGPGQPKPVLTDAQRAVVKGCVKQAKGQFKGHHHQQQNQNSSASD